MAEVCIIVKKAGIRRTETMDMNKAIELVLSSYGICWCRQEVIEAMAVLVRSEILQSIPSSRYYNPQKPMMLADMEECCEQTAEDARCIQKAIESTEGIIAINGSKAVEVFFTKSCDGATANSEDIKGIRVNYLRRVVCRHCSEIEREETVKVSDILQKVGGTHLEYKDNIDGLFKNVVRDREGRIISIDVANTRMTGEEFMNSFHISSNKIYFIEDSITMKICGDGSGLGVCLAGANLLAESGSSYKDIIKYYYTDIVLQSIDQELLSSSLNYEKIIIDPGHGGRDDGNIYNGICEKDANLKIAMYLKEKLEKSEGDIILTRYEDTDVPASSRVAMINRERPNFYISIHQNSFMSPKVNGAESYCFSGDKEAIKLAGLICSSMESYTGIKNRGVRTGDYYILRQGKVSGIILECMYMSGDENSQRYNDDSYMEIAEGIYRGICAYYHIVPA